MAFRRKARSSYRGRGAYSSRRSTRRTTRYGGRGRVSRAQTVRLVIQQSPAPGPAAVGQAFAPVQNTPRKAAF